MGIKQTKLPLSSQNTPISALKVVIAGLGNSPVVGQLQAVLKQLLIQQTIQDSPEVARVSDQILNVYVTNPDSNTRKSQLSTILQDFISENPFESLVNLVNFFENLDFYEFYKEFIQKGGDSNYLMLSVELYTEVNVLLYQLISQNPQLLEQITSRANDDSESEQANESRHIDLTSMSLPEPLPLTRRFADFVQKFMSDPNAPVFKGGKKEKFRILEKEFARITYQIYGDEYDVICTSGTTNAFKLFAYRAGLKLIFGNSEYPGMLHATSAFEKEIICYDTEDELTEQVLDYLDKDEDETRILVLSSTPRSGNQNLILDPEKLAETIALNSNSGEFKKLYLCVDASQDSRLIKHGDIIFMGKKLGGTNSGLVLVRKTNSESTQIADHLRETSGYNELSIARNMASLFLLWQNQVLTMSDLINSPEIYPETENSVSVPSQHTSIAEKKLRLEVSEAQELYSSDPLLSEHFNLDTRLNDDESFKFDAIFRLYPRPESPIYNKLEEFKRLLSQNYSVEVNFETSRSIEQARRYLQLLEQEEHSQSTQVETTQEAQKFLWDFPSDSLTIPKFISASKFVSRREVITNLRNYIQANNCLRIRIAATDTPGTFQEFLRRVSLAINEL